MPQKVTVATYNVHHCAGLDERVDVERIAGVVAATGADIVGFQELDELLERSGRTHQARLLAERMGRAVDFFPTLERAGGRYGLGLATIEGAEAHLERLPRRGAEEPRGAIVAQVDDLWVIVTHLSRDRFSRASQTRALASITTSLEGPAVLMGDLNQGPRSLEPLREAGLDGDGTSHRTMNGWRARHIDHVLAGGGARVTRSWTIPSDASDHVPLVAEVSLP